MDLRIEFMNRLGDGESVSELCREYGISRKTGHKFKERFQQLGIAGLGDRPRAPKVIPHKTPPELVEVIIAERKRHPSWGPRKLKEVLEKRLGRSFPASSTIGDILDRHDLVEPRTPRERHKPRPTKLRQADAPNEIWCIDYKGQFRLGDGTYCYPLTLTDQFSRFIVGCEGMGAICDEAAREVCQEIFRIYGVPLVMRSDNGAPFASTGLAGLTKLSVFWMRLGILLERIRPASPQDNGRHERMHRTLKAETTRPARTNLLQQQERFDEFVAEFNNERPHEALDMKRPGDVFAASPRAYPSTLPVLEYPTHDDVLLVGATGMIHLHRRRTIYLASALAGHPVGIREGEDGRWLVTFGDLDLGHVHPTSNRFTAITHVPTTETSAPETTEVSPMCPV